MENQVGRELVLGAKRIQLMTNEIFRFRGQRSPLEQHAADLFLECSRVPVLNAAHFRVKIPLERILDRN